MTKRIVLIAIAIALSGAVTVGPARADERPCVSQREYRHVQETLAAARVPGWRQARVADHFDIDGTRIFFSRDGSDIDAVWKYRKCSEWGPGGWYVGIWYDNYTWEGDRYMRVYRKTPSRPSLITQG